MELFFNLDFQTLLKTIGYTGLFAIIFAESGLLIGFFFPGDSLLFTAGFLASRGFFEYTPLVIGTFFAAVAGDSVGYLFGKKIGPSIWNRDNSRFFHKDHLERAKIFYEKHGGKTIILARFMPVIRTFAPIVAGMGRMQYKAFIFYNIMGGIIWAVGVPSIGYFLGNAIPDVDKYLLPIIIAIILTSLLPTFIHILKNKDHRIYIITAVKKKLRSR